MCGSLIPCFVTASSEGPGSTWSKELERIKHRSGAEASTSAVKVQDSRMLHLMTATISDVCKMMRSCFVGAVLMATRKLRAPFLASVAVQETFATIVAG